MIFRFPLKNENDRTLNKIRRNQLNLNHRVSFRRSDRVMVCFEFVQHPPPHDLRFLLKTPKLTHLCPPPLSPPLPIFFKIRIGKPKLPDIRDPVGCCAVVTVQPLLSSIGRRVQTKSDALQFPHTPSHWPRFTLARRDGWDLLACYSCSWEENNRKKREIRLTQTESFFRDVRRWIDIWKVKVLGRVECSLLTYVCEFQTFRISI